jgi:hypothetical protein
MCKNIYHRLLCGKCNGPITKSGPELVQCGKRQRGEDCGEVETINEDKDADMKGGGGFCGECAMELQKMLRERAEMEKAEREKAESERAWREWADREGTAGA